MTRPQKTGYRCLRCNHVTFPRGKGRPLRCGGCKSPYWDTERRA
jgi:DNA-directed RNA polymerase subunit RPC12/RpoP